MSASELLAIDQVHTPLYNEYAWALEEHRRLCRLFREAMWYAFEVRCRGWKAPWCESCPYSMLILCGARHETKSVGRGRYPIYYHGAVAEAPALPLEILARELELSLSEVERCRVDMEAPYDWAPGGVLYEKLIREGESVKEYERRRLSNTLGSNGRRGP